MGGPICQIVAGGPVPGILAYALTRSTLATLATQVKNETKKHHLLRVSAQKRLDFYQRSSNEYEGVIDDSSPTPSSADAADPIATCEAAAPQ